MEDGAAEPIATDPIAAEPRPFRRRIWRLPRISFGPTLFFAYIGVALAIFAFYVPPFQKSDELAHFYRAVSLTNLDLVCKTDADGNRYYPMKQKYAAVESVFHVWDVALQYNKKFDNSWLNARFTDPSYQQEVRVDHPCDFSPLGYAPSSAGVLLGKPFESPLASLYLGRLAGALFFLGGVIVALKVTPERYRPLVYLYAALPSVLHQVTTISYDAVHLSLLPPVFAYFTRFLAGERPIKRWDLAVFLALTAWLVNVRLVAFMPLILLFFVIEPSRISELRSRYLTIAGAFVGSAVALMLALSLLYYPQDTAFTDVGTYDSFDQLEYLLKGPWRFPAVVYDTLRLKLELLLGQGVAGFGWQDYGLDYFTYYIFLFAAFGVLIRTVLQPPLKL
ncbi:MAG TPA: DUF2142 domain-containing protein, partial [Dehalococcoidia bacterium]|nr:DUF2142 domain-containing protein [Dehalococcoidia bacterium]